MNWSWLRNSILPWVLCIRRLACCILRRFLWPSSIDKISQNIQTLQSHLSCVLEQALVVLVALFSRFIKQICHHSFTYCAFRLQMNHNVRATRLSQRNLQASQIILVRISQSSPSKEKKNSFYQFWYSDIMLWRRGKGRTRNRKKAREAFLPHCQ